MVKKLSRDTFERAAQAVKECGRPLERRLYEDYFEEPCRDKIIEELKGYQNGDGGFGNGLEPDYLLPDSSPLATSIGLRHLVNLDEEKAALEMIEGSIKYLEKTFLPERNGWYAVSEKVNNFPHTPWWHYDQEEGMTVIDKHRGNPSAELIGYLARYRGFVSRLDVERLVDYTVNYLREKEGYASFHEIYCFARMEQLLPEDISEKLKPYLTRAVQETVSADQEEWETGYVARPLDFISGKLIVRKNRPVFLFGLKEEVVAENLDYLIVQLEEHKKVYPNWDKKYYQGGLEESWEKWVGVLTLESLITLERFGRIER